MPPKTQAHAHPHPHPHPQPQQQQQMQMIARPDPRMQQAIDLSFRAVPLKVGPPNNSTALCSAHSLEVCKTCKVDFSALNSLARNLIARPELAIPPPPNIISQPLTQSINKAKEDGNTAYKQQKYANAAELYTAAATMATSRSPWELSQLMKEEVAIVICNRSAAYAISNDFTNALGDAELVIQLKRPWSKGHFRKGKALVGLGRLEEAKEAVLLGLQYEPSSQEMLTFLAEIEAEIKQKKLKPATTQTSELAASPTDSTSTITTETTES